ncbi:MULTISPECIES: hypothetical protein [Kitasatospora]|uniref:hypothetical protein n=1 Tax=Kitasatospora TaxID=2063 RepID=UPI0004BFEA51|nr:MULTISPECIES: hypothetical protein [Kitasatospora]
MIEIRADGDTRADADRRTPDAGPDAAARRIWAPLAGARLPEPPGRSRASAGLDGAPARVAARLAERGALPGRTAAGAVSGAVALDRARFELLALCHLVVEDTRAPDWIAGLGGAPAIEPHGALVLGALCHLALSGVGLGPAPRRSLADAPRTWWQLAAGAGCVPAVHALALHCEGRGEQREARRWRERASGLVGHEDVGALVLAGYGGLRPTHGLCAGIREALVAALPGRPGPGPGRTPTVAPDPLAGALHRHRTGPCCVPSPL